MTFRAAVVGIVLGTGISLVTYFNDMIIRQTPLIGSQFPIVIFGILLLLVFCVNPLLHAVHPGWRLKRGEIAVIIAVGLAACAWPGGGFFHFFAGIVSSPGRHYVVRTAFQEAHVLSYVPGGSRLLARGYVREWEGFAAELASAADGDGSGPAKRTWELLPATGRRIVRETVRSGVFPRQEKSRFIDAMNEVLKERTFYRGEEFSRVSLPGEVRDRLWIFDADTASQYDIEALNRALAVAAFPRHILPAPGGGGVLLEHGDANTDAMASLMQGERSTRGSIPGLDIVPWEAWKPLIIFWGSAVLLLALASVCIVIIVQPQWKREMLPYPIVQFVREVTAPANRGPFPAIASVKLFWYGVVIVCLVHLVNGLSAWFPQSFFIKIPLQFDISSLQVLAPVYLNTVVRTAVLSPQFFLSVVAFTFFLNTDVSFSAGISGFVYAAIYVIVTGYGIEWKKNAMDVNIDTMLRFGACLGSAVIIFYLGRRYYLNVFTSAAGIRRRHEETPASSVWALRLMAVCIALMTWVLVRNQVEWYFALMNTLLFLVFLTVLTRIVAETGLFLVVLRWMPVAVILMIFGRHAMGPTAFIVLAMLCYFFAWVSQEAAMPFFANGMAMTRDPDHGRTNMRIVGTMVGMLVAGFAVSLVVTLYLQYRYGLNIHCLTPTKWLPFGTFQRLLSFVTELDAYNELSSSIRFSGMERIQAIKPDVSFILWAAAGFGLVLGSTFLRTRFAWWPIHPVLFLVWGTWFPCRQLSASILAGWAIKAAVVRFSGARGYHAVKPLMVGVIAGEVLASLAWMAVGLVYFLATGKTPVSYMIFIMP